MFGFLLKLVFVVFLVGAVAFAYFRFTPSGQSSSVVSNWFDRIRQGGLQTVSGEIGSRLSSFLDGANNSPMVMGVQITNRSLEAMVDTLTSLPPEDLAAVRQIICQPATDSSR